MDSPTSSDAFKDAPSTRIPNTPAWGDGVVAESFPALAGDAEADVCVVGLGGSGLSCIHELLRLGQKVVGVDAGIVGGGAAGRNGGFLLGGTAEFHHKAIAGLGHVRAREIYQLTLDEIGRISAETAATVRRVGSLRIAASDAEERDCDLELKAMLADGFPAEPYKGQEGTGLYFPSDAVFNPLERCRMLAHNAAGDGAELHEQTRAISIGDGEVNTSSGRIRCKHIIVAIDGKLEILLPEIAGRVRTARLQMLSTIPAPEVDYPYPVYRRWGFDYWQQLPDGRVVIGGCRDRFEASEWTADSEPTDQVQECIESVLRTVVGVQQPVARRWAASVAYSNSILPVLEQPRPDVWAIGGYNGTGNVIGAIYGRMVAQIAVTGESELRAVFEG